MYWVDPLDVLVAPMMADYKDKKFRNIDDAGLELPELDQDEAEKEAETAVPDADFNRLVGRFVTTLGDKVVEVRQSKVLKNSPVRLVSPEDAQNREMQRLYRFLTRNMKCRRRFWKLTVTIR